jgi:hypothetical protein
MYFLSSTKQLLGRSIPSLEEISTVDRDNCNSLSPQRIHTAAQIYICVGSGDAIFHVGVENQTISDRNIMVGATVASQQRNPEYDAVISNHVEKILLWDVSFHLPGSKAPVEITALPVYSIVDSLDHSWNKTVLQLFFITSHNRDTKLCQVGRQIMVPNVM